MVSTRGKHSNYIKEHDREVKAFWYQRISKQKKTKFKQGTDLQIYKNGSKNLINSNNKSLSIITLTILNSATEIHRTHWLYSKVRPNENAAYKTLTSALKTHTD